MSLLEFAEEKLECSHVVMCVKEEEDNNKRAVTVRNFLFLGFQPLAPGHEFLPPTKTELVSECMNSRFVRD